MFWRNETLFYDKVIILVIILTFIPNKKINGLMIFEIISALISSLLYVNLV